ncbi:MAG: (d)CMP kinase [OCS116 cluster bacterium]|nr:(d)CMP kinase [OCS116 cluster bacterium]
MNIANLLTTKPAKVGHVKFIGIDGHGGSGKSTLAKLLAQKLNATLVHTDDFASHEVLFEWQQKLIDAVFTPIISGSKLLNYQCSKWWADHHPKPVINQLVTPIMIIEGVSALRQEFRPYLSFGIYVDTPTDICLTRGLARDKDNGNSIEQITQMWMDWIAAENEYLKRDNPQAYADIIISGTNAFHEQIEL